MMSELSAGSFLTPPLDCVKEICLESGEKLPLASSGHVVVSEIAGHTRATGVRPLPSGLIVQRSLVPSPLSLENTIRSPVGAQAGWSATVPLGGCVICLTPLASVPMVKITPQDCS